MTVEFRVLRPLEVLLDGEEVQAGERPDRHHTSTQLEILEEDLSPILLRLGRDDDAVRVWEQALEPPRAVGNNRANGVAAKLALVRGPGPE